MSVISNENINIKCFTINEYNSGWCIAAEPAAGCYAFKVMFTIRFFFSSSSLVTRRRQKCLEALPGCSSEPQEVGSPAKWLAPLYPISNPLKTRELGNIRVEWCAGSSRELVVWFNRAASDEFWRKQRSIFLGLASPQPILEATEVDFVTWRPAPSHSYCLFLLWPKD